MWKNLILCSLACMTVLAVSVSLCHADQGILKRLPDVVKDKVSLLEDFKGDMGRWSASDGVSLAKVTDTLKGMTFLEAGYSIRPSTPERFVEFRFRDVNAYPNSADIIGERLRFWLKGDGSGNLLKVSFYDSKNESWTEQAQIPLDFTGLKHIEVPASNPVYYFYKTVTAFRFTISKVDNKGSQTGKIAVGKIEFASPKPVKSPLPKKSPPQPIFVSWGGPGADQVEMGAKIGIDMHFVPMGFPDGDPDNFVKSAEHVGKLLKSCRDAGMQAGIQFYNCSSAQYAKDHQDLFPRNSEGKSLYDFYSGGSFLSPWNPVAQDIWFTHIKATLRYLKAHDYLKYSDAVMISPGTEGELSHDWSCVWAFDKYAVEAYHDYLKRAYNKHIETLNSDWCSTYASFEEIMPPASFYPDREHWVFQDFYRWSMLKWCVQLAQAVKEEYTPKYWYWLSHTIDTYPMRYYSARYPYFYADNLRRLGVMDYTNLVALDWQGVQDVDYIKTLGVRPLGEIDVIPTVERLKLTFEISKKYGYDGVYVGILENLSSEGKLTPVGELCRELIEDYKVFKQK
ncbi:MAG: beta-galactosidase [Armatimonadota bacterium]